jgi:probable HAF family extracellular repeat protein
MNHNQYKFFSQFILIIITIVACTIYEIYPQQPELIWIGTLGGNQSDARAVSEDGSVVVGASKDANGNLHAFRWTSSNGMQDLGTLGGDWSEATDVSADGSVIVGWSYDANEIFRAFKWTAGTGMVDLGAGDYSKAYGISDNGSAIIIDVYPYAYRWTQSGGLEDLGNLGGSSSSASGISANGSKICGYSYVSAGDPYAFRWVEGTGMEQIGTFYSFARGISANGNTITGSETGSAGLHKAFRWTESGGFEFNIAGNFSYGNAVSGDGSIIVGDFGDGSFRFSNSGGLENLNLVYSSLLSPDSDLSAAFGISSNQLFIVGQGFNGTTAQVEGFLLAPFGTNLVISILTADATTGTQVIEVSTTTGFSIGDNIKINPGGENEEDNIITGFGSMLLQNPLQYDHFIGEVVLNLNPTSVEQINSDIPSGYALSNNYPNPFNPTTTINFSIPEMEFVSLKVYNSLGEEVAELINETKPAGNYSVSFDPVLHSGAGKSFRLVRNLSSGVYFYKITAGKFSESKKMIYLK